MSTRWGPGAQCSKTDQVRAVVWALSSTGRCPALDFFESLDEREQQKAQALFDLMAERPMLTNLEKFRRLRREIWELKTTNSRFTCFFDNEGRRLVVVAGFKKQRQAAPPEEIKRAEEVFAAYDP